MHVHLKIKLKSLAAEASIIRREENKRRNYREFLRGHRPVNVKAEERVTPIRLKREPNGTPEQIAAVRSDILDLAGHRRGVVRFETRHTHLAYGFLRGRDYVAMEAKVHNKDYPDWKKIEAMVERYGEGDSRELLQRFAGWKDAAKAHLGIDKAA